MPNLGSEQLNEQNNNKVQDDNTEAEQTENGIDTANANVQINNSANEPAISEPEKEEKAPGSEEAETQESVREPNPRLAFLYNALYRWVKDDTEFAPKGSKQLADTLKDMDSDDNQKVRDAKQFLGRNLEKWLSHKNAHGRTNYDRLCNRAPRGQVNETISYLNNAVGMSISPKDVTARKPLPQEEINATLKFYNSVNSLEAGLNDKGLFGRGGSSDSHKAMIEAFNDMKYITSSYMNADENLEQRKEIKRKAIENAKKAAQNYIDEKRKNAGAKEGDETWRPSTPMGRKRYESAMKLIEQLDKELERMNAPATEMESGPEMEASADTTPETAAVQDNAPEYTAATDAPPENEEVYETAPENNNEPGTSAESSDTPGFAPDPDDPFDLNAWFDKLNSLPSEMPSDPEVAQSTINEITRTLGAIGVVSEITNAGVPIPTEGREDLFYSSLSNYVENELVPLRNQPLEDQWRMIVVAKESEQFNSYVELANSLKEKAQEHEMDGNEINAEENDGPGQETEEKNMSSEGETQPEDAVDYEKQLRNIYGDDYLDPSKYSNIMQNFDFEQGDPATASLVAKNLVASAITAQIARKNGIEPSIKDFHNSVVDVVESPAFKNIIADNGSPNPDLISWGTIKRLTQKLAKDDGKSLMGNYMQNASYLKASEKQNQEIKEEAQKTRNRSNALTKEENIATRKRSNALHQKTP